MKGAGMAHAGLEYLKGRELSSVEFVRNYLQLRFDGPCFSIYTMPVVFIRGVAVSSGEEGYERGLVSIIGGRVDDIEVSDGESISIRFSGGQRVSISVRAEGRRAAEAANLVTEGDVIWTW